MAASVHDVAAAILKREHPLDTFKLQKLAYYCEAWHLVWEGEPLFSEPIEAWAGGPVVPELYAAHRGRYSIDAWPQGSPSKLTESQRDTVHVVVAAYGKLTGRQLSQLTHGEEPWRKARGGLAPGARGSQVIELDDLLDYYSGLDQSQNATPVEAMAVAVGD